MSSPVASPAFAFASPSRPSWYPHDTELRTILSNIPLKLSTISGNLHGSGLVEEVFQHVFKGKDTAVGSPPPTPAPLPHNEIDVRAHKRRKSDNSEELVAKSSLAEDIHRILLSSVQVGHSETMRHTASITTPVSATTEFQKIPEIARRNSYRPWEDNPAPRPFSMFPMEAQSMKRKFEGDDGLRQLSAVAAAQPTSEVSSKERVRSPEVSSSVEPAASGKSHRCPYYIRDKTGRTHPKCASRTFPNPRKLKEHVWQTTRPYKCSTCLFGFGRDKTRAIHVKERKKGCKPPPPGSALLRESYENSPEHIRDQRIEAARSSEEIVEILNDYDKAKGPDARDNQSYEDEDGSEVGSQEDEYPYQRMRAPDDYSQDPHSQIRLPSIRSATSPVLEAPELPSKFTPVNHSILTPPHSRTSSQTHISPLSPLSPVRHAIFSKSGLTLPPLQINLNHKTESWQSVTRISGILSN